MTNKPTQEEIEFFKKILGDKVKPLSQDKISVVPQTHTKITIHGPWPEEQKLPYISDALEDSISLQDYLSFKRDGVQAKYFRELKNGLLPIQAEFDLHGMKLDEAKTICLKEILLSVDKGLRVIKFIHGKGYRSGHQKAGKLKQQLNHWLPQLENVLAFCSAPPNEGGTGAILILLKRL